MCPWHRHRTPRWWCRGATGHRRAGGPIIDASCVGLAARERVDGVIASLEPVIGRRRARNSTARASSRSRRPRARGSGCRTGPTSTRWCAPTSTSRPRSDSVRSSDSVVARMAGRRRGSGRSDERARRRAPGSGSGCRVPAHATRTARSHRPCSSPSTSRLIDVRETRGETEEWFSSIASSVIAAAPPKPSVLVRRGVMPVAPCAYPITSHRRVTRWPGHAAGVAVDEILAPTTHGRRSIAPRSSSCAGVRGHSHAGCGATRSSCGVSPLIVDATIDRDGAVEQCLAAFPDPTSARRFRCRCGGAQPSRQGTLAARTKHDEAFAREVLRHAAVDVGAGADHELVAAGAGSVSPGHSGITRPAARCDRRQSRRCLTYRPRVSVVVPVHKHDPAVLRAMVESVHAQSYSRCSYASSTTHRRVARPWRRSPNWTPPMTGTAAPLDSPTGSQARPTPRFAMATGAYVAFVDHDDVLAPNALYWIVRRLELDGDLDVLYSDEDNSTSAAIASNPSSSRLVARLCCSVNYVTTSAGGPASFARRESADSARDSTGPGLRTATAAHRTHGSPRPTSGTLYSWRRCRDPLGRHPRQAGGPSSERSSDRGSDCPRRPRCRSRRGTATTCTGCATGGTHRRSRS